VAATEGPARPQAAAREEPDSGALREVVRRVDKVLTRFMGLLEEAIREHLELQRRRGGDPRQIALAEREALEPLVPGQTPDWAQGPALFDAESALAADGLAAAAQGVAPGLPAEASQLPAEASQLPAEPFVTQASGADMPVSADPSMSVGGAALEQETAELDMSTVLFNSPTAEDRRALEYAALQAPAAAEPAGDPSQAIPEFGGVRARRIVADPSPPDSGEPDFEWEIPGVTRASGSGA